MMLEVGARQLGKGLLRARQVTGLEGLTDGVEILLSLVCLEFIPVGERPTLAEILDGAEFLLRSSEVSGLERLAELLQIGIARLKICLQFLVNRSCGNGC